MLTNSRGVDDGRATPTGTGKVLTLDSVVGAAAEANQVAKLSSVQRHPLPSEIEIGSRPTTTRPKQERGRPPTRAALLAEKPQELAAFNGFNAGKHSLYTVPVLR